MRASLLFLVNLRRSPRLASPRVSARSLARAPPPSPLADFVAFSESSASLRTGLTHGFGGLGGGVDRAPAAAFRAECRAQRHTGQTSGFAPGFVQANFVMLPRDAAFDFLLWALRNPKACPVLSVTAPGERCPENVAPGADLARDIPRYRVWRDGELAEELADVTHLWADDMVGFLIGCSFTWEDKLAAAGLPPRHVEQAKNVPMFKTNVPNRRVGVFAGEVRARAPSPAVASLLRSPLTSPRALTPPLRASAPRATAARANTPAQLVVSMRPYRPEQIEAVTALTGAYPGAHGGPVHWGDPAALGIDPARLGAPDWGEPIEVREGEVPVFWACGVTPHAALMAAKLPLAVTHAPGHMFVCDVTDDELHVATSAEATHR